MMTNDCHFSCPGSQSGGILLTTSLLDGEDSPPSDGSENTPGLNQSSIFSDEPRKEKSMNWLWIIVLVVAALLAWKYIF